MTVSGATIPSMEKENYTASSHKHLTAPLIFYTFITKLRIKTLTYMLYLFQTKQY